MLGKAAKEAAKYLRKLKKKSVKAKSEAKTPTQNKKAKKLEESYEKESKLANPNLTMDERAEVLGGYKKGGMLKTPDNPGLKKLPTEVRNKMGYMKKGGKVKKGYHKMPDGSMMKNSAHKMSCGGKVHKMKAGGKVRGDGICKTGKTKGRMI